MQTDVLGGYLANICVKCTSADDVDGGNVNLSIELIECSNKITAKNSLSTTVQIPYNVNTPYVWNVNGDTDLFLNSEPTVCTYTSCVLKSADCSASFTSSYISLVTGTTPDFVVNAVSNVQLGWV